MAKYFLLSENDASERNKFCPTSQVIEADNISAASTIVCEMAVNSTFIPLDVETSKAVAYLLFRIADEGEEGNYDRLSFEEATAKHPIFLQLGLFAESSFLVNKGLRHDVIRLLEEKYGEEWPKYYSTMGRAFHKSELGQACFEASDEDYEIYKMNLPENYETEAKWGNYEYGLQYCDTCIDREILGEVSTLVENGLWMESLEQAIEREKALYTHV